MRIEFRVDVKAVADYSVSGQWRLERVSGGGNHETLIWVIVSIREVVIGREGGTFNQCSLTAQSLSLIVESIMRCSAVFSCTSSQKKQNDNKLGHTIYLRMKLKYEHTRYFKLN